MNNLNTILNIQYSMCIFISLAGIFRHLGGQIRAAMLGKIKVCS